VKLGLAGDTMLGRKVGERLATAAPQDLFAGGVVDAAREADLLVVNLECAISDRGARWPDPRKPFFFRAPPVAAEVLAHLGVGCVTLANNHALDFGPEALLDTFRHLRDAGIAWVGAGADEAAARAPAVIERAGCRIGVVGATDHPHEFAAGPDRPGVAYADLRRECPAWLLGTVRDIEADVVLVTPHWGPNTVAAPVTHVRTAAASLLDAGATLIAGHSAHVFHGVVTRVLYDLGDFIDDYARDPDLHNELGLLWLVSFAGSCPTLVEAVPITLEYCHTRLAVGAEHRWIGARLRRACGALGTEVGERGDRFVIEWPSRTVGPEPDGMMRP
jgi:poly-gamma-glutamate synthesis protein (capsule biosynthesis protein)